MNSHTILAYQLDGKGGVTNLDSAEVSDSKSENVTWYHLDVTHVDTRCWLESEFPHLDSYVIDALLIDETRPRMTKIGDGALIILRGANLNENADPEDMVSIRLWVQEKMVVSLQKRELKATVDIVSLLREGRGPKDSGEIVNVLMDRLLKRIEPVLVSLDDTTDEIEESLLETTQASFREEIVNVRKQAIMFKRYMVPQREAVDQMRMSGLSWLNERHRQQLQENYNHITRYVEDLDAIRERAQIIKDELANMLSDKLNKNMYMLSVIAAIFLPLGFLTGLLGINVGGIPGAENGNGFWLFTGALLLIAVAQVMIFKKLKWF